MVVYRVTSRATAGLDGCVSYIRTATTRPESAVSPATAQIATVTLKVSARMETCGAADDRRDVRTDEFWRLRTMHGTNGVRHAGIDAARREVVLAAPGRRLATLRRSDYEFGGTLASSISIKPADGGRR